jgi:hypothetical protein
MEYVNQWSDTEKKIVKIPFFYGFSSDERFVQDYFEQGLWSDCYPNWIEGNYDPIPRGHIMLQGVNIKPEELTSRYVRGFYTKEENGELKRYNSYINSIPIRLTFDAKILVDWSDIVHFKVIESAFRSLWRTIVFNVAYEGFMVPCRAGFPETYAYEKLFEYTYQTGDARTPVTFTIEADSFLPIPDPLQEFFAGKRIENFGINVEPQADSELSSNQSSSTLFPSTSDQIGSLLNTPGSHPGNGSSNGSIPGTETQGGSKLDNYVGDPNYWQ